MANRREQASDELLGPEEDPPELDWAIIESLLDAHANTNASLER